MRQPDVAAATRALPRDIASFTGRRFEGKVAVVTGAGSGVGRAVAHRLAREGADIIGVDVCGDLESIPYPLATPADLDETVSMVEAAGGRMVAGSDGWTSPWPTPGCAPSNAGTR